MANTSGGEMLATWGNEWEAEQQDNSQGGSPGPQPSDVGHGFETTVASSGFFGFH